MKAGSGSVVVLIGATSTVGRELRDVLRERGFPIAELRLYDSLDADEERSWTDDEADADVRSLDGVECAGADVVFICRIDGDTADWAARAATEGALAIDVTHALADATDAALIVPEVNADVLDEDVAAGVLVCPVPGATALAVVLKPLHDAAELRRVVVTALEPVSALGDDGVEELAGQTRALLTGTSVDPQVFPQRIAFNLIPQLGEFVPGDRTLGEWRIESQTRAVLALPDLPIAVTSVCVPIFFGRGYAVHVETERPLDAAAARAVLREAPGVLLAPASGVESYATPADVLGSDATHVGRVRDDPTVPFGVALWVVLDGLRKGAAVNAVQIAEHALRGRQ